MQTDETNLLVEWGWFLSGRQLLWSELPFALQEKLQAQRPQLNLIQIKAAIQKQDQQFYCCRCQTAIQSDWQLASGYYYCSACLGLGRVSQMDDLVYLPEQNNFPTGSALTWSGELTATQKQVSTAILKQFQTQPNVQLLWAVTGAGKTEMTFPLIDAYLAQRGRVGLVSPRIDVCNELAPRLATAFAHTSQGLLHGQQHEPYRYPQLVIATTHQMLRFREAFDLLIVDEVDAFPYAHNLMLQKALARAVKRTGRQLYLSATPPVILRRTAEKQQSLHYLPRRFHGRPLPLPQLMIGRVFKQGGLGWQVRQIFQQLLPKKRRILVFVPQAQSLAIYEEHFRNCFPEIKTQTVHAKDRERIEKVAAFRAGDGQVLFTTTILERGVTLAHVDIVVLNANHPNFTLVSLVQIAGRADRAVDGPNGQVFFCSEYVSFNMIKARQQIQQLNQKAGF